MEDRYHYGVIRRALDILDQSDRQISLDELAAQMGMSSGHFQRLFSNWVGVSPKKYQQYLTLDHAKSLLSDRFTTLETAHAVGVSGSGRLHDLFISWEAMTPGEFARGGDGVAITYGWFDSPFGEALVMGTSRGICGMAFADEMGRDTTFQDMARRWPAAQFTQSPETLRPFVEGAFGGTETRLLMIGAPFQQKVWEALVQIPSGMVTTYGEIAQAIGSPKAVRAVGTAVGKNPISWLIPCHRAIRKSGGLGGYHWGLPVKRAMLAYEAAQSDHNRENSRNLPIDIG
jgi:AraC family transcriptional regulator, regulatory protein of adaptative response / methylated-DNA-[protein]-cysteine methyltransferase